MTAAALIAALIALTACAAEPEPLLDIDYAGWRNSTSLTLDFAVPGHGAGLRRIFVNDAGWQARPDADGNVMYPDGTIFLKEVYASPVPGPDEAPVMLTGMVKSSGGDRSRGDWIWVVRNVADGTETILDEEFCITCHASANEEHPYGFLNQDDTYQDYIFHPPWYEASRR